MNVEKNFKSLARSVLLQAALDCRRPKLCTRCGKKIDLPNMKRLVAEAKDAYAFLMKGSHLYVSLADLAQGVVQDGATRERGKVRKICGCYVEDRDPKCEDWKSGRCV